MSYEHSLIFHINFRFVYNIGLKKIYWIFKYGVDCLVFELMNENSI